MLLTLWRQERFLSAERVAVAMLWLDPGDRFGAAGLLDLVRRRVRWYPGFTDDDEPRTEAVLRTRRPVHVLPGSLREQLIPSAAGAVSPATVAAVVRRAAALALGGTRAEQHVVVPARDGSRDSVWVRIVARHQRGHSVEPDEYWWDAHTRGAHGDAEPTLFVLVGDAGQILLAQLLRPAELRQYRAAPLPRRDRTAFTTSFVHHRVRYGVDLTSAVDAALNHQGTEDWL